MSVGSHSIVDDNVREALQLFSARLAHDFNNLLTPLIAYPDMIALELPQDGKSIKFLRSMESAAERAVEITSRLGDFSGAMRNDKRQVLVSEAVNAVLSDLKHSDSAAGMQIESVCDDIEVEISPDAFSLAVLELCQNSLDALQGQGTLRVRVSRRKYTDLVESVSGKAPAGDYVVVDIDDDGAGMSSVELKEVLEPFCAGSSGHRRGGGGLGLSMAFCALRENGAYLVINSEEGRGTHCAIMIPSNNETDSAKDEAEVETANGIVSAKNEGPAKILVVDDEPSIVNLFKLVLENFIQGVRVDVASTGAEALSMFDHQRYDVIVMDLHMPVMDGQTAFLEMEKVCQQKDWTMPSIVFCTGYAPRDVVKRAVSEGTRHTLLNKPVRSEVLVKAVQSRLETFSK